MSVSPKILLIAECCMSMPLTGKSCGEVSLEHLELSCLCIRLGQVGILVGLLHTAMPCGTRYRCTQYSSAFPLFLDICAVNEYLWRLYTQQSTLWRAWERCH